MWLSLFLLQITIIVGLCISIIHKAGELTTLHEYWHILCACGHNKQIYLVEHKFFILNFLPG